MTGVQRVLVIDDDGHIREVVSFALAEAGFAVECAKDGAEGLALCARAPFDAVVLDIVMPELDGLEVCRRLRAKSRVPIVFLSSRDEELDRVLGLELGGDDYLSKPFSPRELVARVKAVLRRAQPPEVTSTEAQVLRRGPLAMDLGRHRCTFGMRAVELTVTEFALLRTLLAAPGRVLSRDELVDRAYGHGHVITDRTVDSHIRRLRQKLAAVGADPVETVYGLGYRLREELEP